MVYERCVKFCLSDETGLGKPFVRIGTVPSQVGQEERCRRALQGMKARIHPWPWRCGVPGQGGIVEGAAGDGMRWRRLLRRGGRSPAQ